MLGHLAVVHAEEVVKARGLARELPLAHDENEVPLAQHLVDAVVLHRDAVASAQATDRASTLPLRAVREPTS